MDTTQNNGQEAVNDNIEHNLEEAAMNFNADDSLSGSTHLNDELTNNDATDENNELQIQLKEANEKYLRLFAEFDNFRKRNAKERIELVKTAGEEVIKSLLDVLDDTVRAQTQIETSDDIEAIKEGVNLVFNKFKLALANKGLKEMESKGEDFNVELHEAIAEIPAPNDEMKGKVMDEVQKGYYLNEKIIRHAKVVIGK